MPTPSARSRDTVVLSDLTAGARFGLKGRGASAWLGSRGLAPPAVNAMSRQAHVDLVRLGQEDFLLLSREGGASRPLADIRAAWEAGGGEPRGFNSWRDESWAWFHLGGEDAAAFLAGTCPVDLVPRAFGQFGVAQTRVALMDCVVVRSDRLGATGFDLFFDIASSEYMLDTLLDLGATRKS